MSLYKYVTPERIDILRNGLIRFTQPSAFNDPFECKPVIRSLTRGIDLSQPISIPPTKEILSKAKIDFAAFRRRNRLPPLPPGTEKRYWVAMAKAIDSLANFSLKETLEDEESKAFIGKMFLGGLGTNLGVLSLAEKADNLLMWSHYAQQHTGFVIEFDDQDSYFKRISANVLKHDPLVLQKVRYSDKRPHITSLKNFEERASWYLVKSKQWKYEQEWRMMRRLVDGDVCLRLHNNRFVKMRRGELQQLVRILEQGMRPEEVSYLHLFSLPPSCIKGIIVGCRMFRRDKLKMLRLLTRDTRYAHVKSYCATIDESTFKLNIIPWESERPK